jgi:3-phenylpropionate/trans-cinnamate dioxygenase ferredoxin reductase subunit
MPEEPQAFCFYLVCICEKLSFITSLCNIDEGAKRGKMPAESADYFIIGGGLAGGYAAVSIRGIDKSGRIIIVTDEEHIPYDRVPLSKKYLTGDIALSKLFFKKEEFYKSENIEVITGRSATELNIKEHIVKLDDGLEFSFGKLLLATGGKPRKLPIQGSETRRVYYLRTIEDCEILKEEIMRSKRVVVIGGGFIGCELASAFAMKNLETTIIEVGPYLLNMAIDQETGQWLGEYYTQKGVTVLVNASVSRFDQENGHVSSVELKDGRKIFTDFVVIGVGIAVGTELAEKAGLKVEKGIVVDEFLETNAKGIFAAGDVARFYSPIFKRHLRLEHYDIAVKHGKIAGLNMAGAGHGIVASWDCVSVAS